MARKLRLGLLACAGIAALAVSAPALAAFMPQLAVSPTAGGTLIHYSQPSGDDAALKTTIYSDAKLTANLTAAAGTTIGSVAAKTAAGALGGATLPLGGTIVARGAADTYLSNGTPTPIASAATACTGTATHTAFWVLILSAAGQTLEVPMFIDALAAPDPRAAFAGVSIVLCLPSPYVPPPAGAAFGAKVFDAALTMKGVFSGPPGEYTWRAVVTPWTPGTATPNAAGTVEVQSKERAAQLANGVLTASAKRKGTTAVVSGSVEEAGSGVPGVRVTIRGGTKVVTATTGAGGKFHATVKLRSRKTRVLSLTASVPTHDLGAAGCTATFSALGIPCIDATIGGLAVTATARIR